MHDNFQKFCVYNFLKDNKKIQDRIKMNKSNKKLSNFESQQEDDIFWRNSFKSLPTINEDNESLLFDVSSN